MSYSDEKIEQILTEHFPFADVEYEDNGPEVFCGAPSCHYMRTERPYGWHREPWTVEHIFKAFENEL